DVARLRSSWIDRTPQRARPGPGAWRIVFDAVTRTERRSHPDEEHGASRSVVQKPAGDMIVQCGLVPGSNTLHTQVRALLGENAHPHEQVVAFLDGINLDDAQLGFGNVLLARHVADAQAIALAGG